MSTRALEVGSLIHARYRVERVLGEGGFGVTYQVTDLKESRTAAMKEYMPADIAYRRPYSKEVHPKQEYVEAYQKFRDKFLDEARIIYRFRGHPNIIDVTHLFYDNNTAYYVMEYINGKDLDRYLKERGGRLSWQELYPIMAQVVSALQQVHHSNMIHCDISPDNIFLLDKGQVKLIDFGAAKSVLHGQSSMILLKRGFAPPEQLYSGGNLGPWTDVYALAVTLYRAYTGKMPPTSEDRMVSDQTIWPSQMGIAAPSPQWEAALRRAMSLRWEDRFQDVTSFWKALASGAGQDSHTLPQDGSQPAPAPCPAIFPPAICTSLWRRTVSRAGRLAGRFRGDAVSNAGYPGSWHRLEPVQCSVPAPISRHQPRACKAVGRKRQPVCHGCRLQLRNLAG